jgi:hypothetical protein
MPVSNGVEAGDTKGYFLRSKPFCDRELFWNGRSLMREVSRCHSNSSSSPAAFELLVHEVMI